MIFWMIAVTSGKKEWVQLSEAESGHVFLKMNILEVIVLRLYPEKSFNLVWSKVPRVWCLMVLKWNLTATALIEFIH